MASVKKTAKSSLGQELVRRLKRFSEDLETTDELELRFTCRTIQLKLRTRDYGPDLVKATRRKLGASQVIFAKFLGVAPNTVRDWEQGVKLPRGAACRMMDEIRENPEYWIARLTKMARPAKAL